MTRQKPGQRKANEPVAKSKTPKSPISARFFRSISRLQDLPRDGRPHIAYVGRSNVGKSSLINYLTQRKSLAKTSKTPGKTRVLNFYEIGGDRYYVDLPGYGYAAQAESLRAFWATVVSRYLMNSQDLKLVVWLLDVRREPSERDQDMWALLRTVGRPIVIAVTKCDKFSSSKVHQSIAAIRRALVIPKEVRMVQTSAVKRRGRRELLGLIERAVCSERDPFC